MFIWKLWVRSVKVHFYVIWNETRALIEQLIMFFRKRVKSSSLSSVLSLSHSSRLLISWFKIFLLIL